MNNLSKINFSLKYMVWIFLKGLLQKIYSLMICFKKYLHCRHFVLLNVELPADCPTAIMSCWFYRTSYEHQCVWLNSFLLRNISGWEVLWFRNSHGLNISVDKFSVGMFSVDHISLRIFLMAPSFWCNYLTTLKAWLPHNKDGAR